jgi:hypothetical protein
MQDFYGRSRQETKFEWPPKRSTVSGVLFGLTSGAAMALTAGLGKGNWPLGIFVGAVVALFGGPFFAVRMKKAGMDDGSISTEAVAKEWSDRRLVIAAVVLVAGGVFAGAASGIPKMIAFVVSWLAAAVFLLLRFRSRKSHN